HARTFFHILAHQVLDLAGRNVGIPQNLTPFFHGRTPNSKSCAQAVPARRKSAMVWLAQGR
ncbi:hypothetical protein, partial [Xanthomonas nasturtii]|uniref:hypothetical protein n=1 Tax=Xanthomonas nasturtii TaxID=1843581 RepID=UPI002012E368